MNVFMDKEIEEILNRMTGYLEKEKFVERLWKKDALLWKQDADSKRLIENRLGWLNSVDWLFGKLEELKDFSKKIKERNFKNILLLGMGGSSLAPEVLGKFFDKKQFFMLDSVHPDSIRFIEEKIDLQNTLFIVSSKSGTTIETISLYKYFYSRVKKGENFIAITDEGTPLEKEAKEKGFLRCFINPSDIGGRFSVLSYFGMVPALLCGIDIEKILKTAKKMAEKCKNKIIRKNPGVLLGAELYSMSKQSSDMVKISCYKNIESFVGWAEQILAESSGKEGKGVIPLIEKSPMQAKDKFSIGAEFFKWETATATLCSLLGINAFDEPNVKESKDFTKRYIEDFKKNKKIEDAKPIALDKDLKKHLGLVKEGDFIAILAYLNRFKGEKKVLDLKDRFITEKFNIPVIICFGPRYLHSQGQLFKGGVDRGVYILLTEDIKNDLPIPGEEYTFGNLLLFQALGDLEAMKKRQRRIIRIHLP